MGGVRQASGMRAQSSTRHAAGAGRNCSSGFLLAPVHVPLQDCQFGIRFSDLGTRDNVGVTLQPGGIECIMHVRGMKLHDRTDGSERFNSPCISLYAVYYFQPKMEWMAGLGCGSFWPHARILITPEPNRTQMALCLELRLNATLSQKSSDCFTSEATMTQECLSRDY